MQQSRHGGGGDPDAAVPDVGDGTVDVSFHSPEWHAARIAALTTERVSWEDFKKKQKEEASMAAADAEVSTRRISPALCQMAVAVYLR